MAFLTKKQFIDWAERVWHQNPRSLIKSVDKCRTTCPVYNRMLSIPESCRYAKESNHCEAREFVVCSFYVEYTDFEMDLLTLCKERAEFRQRYETMVEKDQGKTTVQKRKKKIYSRPQKRKSSSWEQRTFGYITEEFKMTNRTAIEINEHRATFINGRYVSTEDLRNDNS